MADPNYDEIIAKAAQEYGVRPELLRSLLHAESTMNPRAVSPRGAQGIAQFMPDTAAELGIDPFDPGQAIPAAAQYLSKIGKRFGGDERKMLAGYNWGPYRKALLGEDWEQHLPKETKDYINKVLGAAPNFSGSQTDQSTTAKMLPEFLPAEMADPAKPQAEGERPDLDLESLAMWFADNFLLDYGRLAHGVGTEVARGAPFFGLPAQVGMGLAQGKYEDKFRGLHPAVKWLSEGADKARAADPKLNLLGMVQPDAADVARLAMLTPMAFFRTSIPEEVEPGVWGELVHGTLGRMWRPGDDLTRGSGEGLHLGSPSAAYDRVRAQLMGYRERIPYQAVAELIRRHPALKDLRQQSSNQFYEGLVKAYIQNPDVAAKWPLHNPAVPDPSKAKRLWVPRFMVGRVNASRPYNTPLDPLDDSSAQTLLTRYPNHDLWFYRNIAEDEGSLSAVVRDPRQFQVKRTFGGALPPSDWFSSTIKEPEKWKGLLKEEDWMKYAPRDVVESWLAKEKGPVKVQVPPGYGVQVQEGVKAKVDAYEQQMSDILKDPEIRTLAVGYGKALEGKGKLSAFTSEELESFNKLKKKIKGKGVFASELANFIKQEGLGMEGTKAIPIKSNYKPKGPPKDWIEEGGQYFPKMNMLDDPSVISPADYAKVNKNISPQTMELYKVYVETKDINEWGQANDALADIAEEIGVNPFDFKQYLHELYKIGWPK